MSQVVPHVILELQSHFGSVSAFSLGRARTIDKMVLIDSIGNSLYSIIESMHRLLELCADRRGSLFRPCMLHFRHLKQVFHLIRNFVKLLFCFDCIFSPAFAIISQ